MKGQTLHNPALAPTQVPTVCTLHLGPSACLRGCVNVCMSTPKSACLSACLYAVQRVRLGLGGTGSHFWFCFEAEGARQEDRSWGRNLNERAPALVMFDMKAAEGLIPSCPDPTFGPQTEAHRVAGPLPLTVILFGTKTLLYTHTYTHTLTHGRLGRLSMTVIWISSPTRAGSFGSQTLYLYSAKCSLF